MRCPLNSRPHPLVGTCFHRRIARHIRSTITAGKEIRPSADHYLTTRRPCQLLARRIHVIYVSGCAHSTPFITFLECTSSHRPLFSSQGRCLARLRPDHQCTLQARSEGSPQTTINTLAHVIPIDSPTTNVRCMQWHTMQTVGCNSCMQHQILRRKKLCRSSLGNHQFRDGYYLIAGYGIG